MASRTAYVPQLDGLRAVAVLMVFLHHAFAVPLLWCGVDLFFILSGFLITNILLRDSGRMSFGALLRNFYLRRAQRILPAYLLSLALIAVLLPQPWGRLWPFYAFFLQNLPYGLHWIGFGPLVPLWSLAVEQHFYLVWPFVVFFLPRRGLIPVLLGIVVAVPLLRAVCTPLDLPPEAIYALTPFRIDAMAAGALAAVLLPLVPVERSRRLAIGASIAGMVAYALLARHHWFRRDAHSITFNTLAYSLNILVLGGVFVWTVLGDARHWAIRLLASTPLRALGRVSYAFYLFHLTVLLYMGRFVARHWVAPATFVGALLLASLSWFALEQPVLRWRNPRHGASLKVQGG